MRTPNFVKRLIGMGELPNQEAKLDLALNKLHYIEGAVNRLLGMELTDAKRDKSMEKLLEELRLAAEEDRNANNAVAKLLADLMDRLEEHERNGGEIAAFIAGVRERSKALADAVTANTPFEASGNAPFDPSAN